MGKSAQWLEKVAERHTEWVNIIKGFGEYEYAEDLVQECYITLYKYANEEKIIELIKSKINLTSKEINTKEAEKIIADFNKPNLSTTNVSETKSAIKNKPKLKKISKK